jgi:hypothetical protein
VVRRGWHENSARIERKYGAVKSPRYGLVVCDLDGEKAKAKFPSKAYAIPAINIAAVSQIKANKRFIAFSGAGGPVAVKDVPLCIKSVWVPAVYCFGLS